MSNKKIIETQSQCRDIRYPWAYKNALRAGQHAGAWIMPTQALESTAPATCPMRRLNPRRLWLAGIGLISVAIGAVGAVVPGLPTTIFLIIGSWCFTRSCPWLEERLIRNRFFRPFLCYLEPGAVIPTRPRVISTVALWIAVTISVTIMIGGESAIWIPIVTAVAGVVGTVCVWAFQRPRPLPPPS